jgi:ubiquitin C-terminal hydrolase
LEEENFINGLFEGETIHIVKCLVCNNESVRSDKFLDLSLPIRNEFLKICNKSLEMAFLNYLKPEYLGAGNEYKCENCAKKVWFLIIQVNAEKFLRFVKLPKILFIQLNRFEYDYISMDKKKIYDKLTYPEILNMNKFFQNEFSKINDFFNPEMLKSLNERKIQNNQEEEIKSSMNEGNLVYELYAMLSHSGTANSGHYKAYIKSFENGICL